MGNRWCPVPRVASSWRLRDRRRHTLLPAPPIADRSLPRLNTNIRMHACARIPPSLSLYALASLILSFFVLALPSARSLAHSLVRSRARGSDATRPSSAVAIASSLFSSASTSGAPAEFRSGFQLCLTRRTGPRLKPRSRRFSSAS